LAALDGGAPAESQYAANDVSNAQSFIGLTGYNMEYGIYDCSETTGEALSSI
jgi:hypothetical protein